MSWLTNAFYHAVMLPNVCWICLRILFWFFFCHLSTRVHVSSTITFWNLIILLSLPSIGIKERVRLLSMQSVTFLLEDFNFLLFFPVISNLWKNTNLRSIPCKVLWVFNFMICNDKLLCFSGYVCPITKYWPPELKKKQKKDDFSSLYWILCSMEACRNSCFHLPLPVFCCGCFFLFSSFFSSPLLRTWDCRSISKEISAST